MYDGYKSPIRPFNMPLRFGKFWVNGWLLLIAAQSAVVLMLAWFILTRNHHLLYIMCEAVSVMVLAGLVWQQWAWTHERPLKAILYENEVLKVIPRTFNPECVVCTEEKDMSDLRGFTSVEIEDMCTYHYRQLNDLRFPVA